MHSFFPALVVLFLLSSIFAPSHRVYACSCATSSVSEALGNASFVFSGRVIDIRNSRSVDAQVFSGTDPLYIFFEVVEIWKGRPYKTMVVSTAIDGASCGYSFQVGIEYMVYTYGDDPFPNVSLCSRTAPRQETHEDLQVLGPGRSPVEPFPDTLLALVPTATVLEPIPHPGAAAYPYPSSFDTTSSTPVMNVYPYPNNSESPPSSRVVFTTARSVLFFVGIMVFAGVAFFWFVRRRT